MQLIPFPDKKYQTIYVDPPWPISNNLILDRGKWTQKLTDKYQLMTLEQIKELPVRELADTKCSMFMWCTHTSLPWALDVMKTWGFKYHCVITWDKCGGFSQHGFHRRTELLLYGYIGGVNLNKTGKFIPTLITEKKTVHSRKPMIARRYIESNSPEPRIELFARQQHDGWDVWGDEV